MGTVVGAEYQNEADVPHRKKKRKKSSHGGDDV
jgi:hypothetical protein